MNIGIQKAINVFLDTDVAYDLVTGCSPFYDQARFVVPLAKQGSIRLGVSSGSLNNLFYFAYDRDKIRDATQRLLRILECCDVANGSRSAALGALHSQFRDKEDAFQYFTAFDFQADYFLTRNLSDFKITSSILPVLTPVQFEQIMF